MRTNKDRSVFQRIAPGLVNIHQQILWRGVTFVKIREIKGRCSTVNHLGFDAYFIKNFLEIAVVVWDLGKTDIRQESNYQQEKKNRFIHHHHIV